MNAILLAAGMGLRIRRLSKNSHKALLPIGGKPNIERTIEYLRNFGIDDLIVVTGHNAYLFKYLKDKYSCNIIYNPMYSQYNNIYSLYLARNYFGDTIVIDADVVLLDNIFTTKTNSFYYTIQRKKDDKEEWCPALDSNGRVKRIDETDAYKPSLLGISYWNKNDAEVIKNKMKDYINKETLQNSKLYWDDIVKSVIDEICITTHTVPLNSATEIDTEEDYYSICDLKA